MNFLRRVSEFLADTLDRFREPGWFRRIAVIVILVLVMLIPYPLSITGDFKMISMNPVMVRSKIEGTLSEVVVKMDDEVEEGQVVARILDVEKRLEASKIDAEIAEADARLRMTQKGFRTEEVDIVRFRVEELTAVARLAKLNLQRQQALFDENALALSDLDVARSEELQAKKVLSQAKQELLRMTNGSRPEEIEQAAAALQHLVGRRAEIEQHLEWTALRAPKAGRVITPDDELRELIGRYLERGTPILSIVDPSELLARVSVDENEFGDVELGQGVLLRPYQFPTLKFSAKVDTIQPFVDSGDDFSSTVSILSRVDDPRWSLLRINTTGKAKVSLGSRPLGAVLYRRIVRSMWVQAWSWY